MSLYLAVFGKPRYLGLVDIGDLELNAGRWIVIETLRGVEMGMLGGTLSQEQEGKYRIACLEESSDEHTKGPEPMLQEVKFIGAASDSQVQEYGERRLDEESVLIRSRQILRDHQFQMKLVDVEYTMDRKKLFFYFTSDQRVDFRAYVRDLAKEFRIRIEMRQIGVRDEAKTVRGVSPCGRPCCCSYWLHRFTPINIRMVKEQNLALNPTKISGICGRLMCCMFYEHSTYSELWKTLPSPGSKIKAPQGTYVLEGVDLRTEMARVSLPEGGELSIPVAEFALFKETVMRGEPWQKDEKKEPEPERRPAMQRGVTHRHVETPEDPSRNNKKWKPEKISIEEHIAERVSSSNKPSQGSVPQGVPKTEDNSAVKKRQHRRKDTPAGQRKQEEPRSIQSADGRRENARPVKERNKPPEQRTQNEPAREIREVRGEAQTPGTDSQGARPAGAGGRRRPRYKGGNRGPERHGTGGAGTAEGGGL